MLVLSSENHSASASSASVFGAKCLDYYDIEWFAFEMNQDYSVIFEIAPKYCISDSLVDYEGYPISFKGFLTAVIDTVVT